MQKFLYLLSLCLMISACDDGDIIEVELAFNQVLQSCELDPDNYFIYDTKTEPSESLSLIFPSNATTDLIFNPDENEYESTLIIDGTNVKFNYRTYDGDPDNLICNLLPDPTTNIINDYAATSGTVNTLTTFIDDDNDGIPSEFEDGNEDGDNNPATNPTDSDGDGIPDYIDADDDNDNVLTIDEEHNYSEANGLSQAQDTDGNDIPDYLDADDDGDGVLTRHEDEDMDGNPKDDRDESTETPTVPRYLNAIAIDNYGYEAFTPTTYLRFITVSFNITNVNLEVISLTEIDFGTYEYSITIEDEDE